MLRNILVVAVVIVVLGLAYTIFVMPDQRTTGEKIGDAIHELPQSPGKAADELKDDRTPGQKMGDAMRRAGDKIKENSDSQ